MTPALSTVRDYLRLVFRRRVALFAPIIISVLLIIPIWLIVPPVYQARARVKRQDLAVVSAAGLAARGGTGVPMQTLRVEILSWSNLERVIQQLNMDVDLHTREDWQRKYESLQEHVRIYSSAKGPGVDLIEIAVTDPDSKRSQAIANAVADIYVEESARQVRQSTQHPVTFLERKETEYLVRLRNAERELQKFTEKRYGDHPEVKRALEARLMDLRTQERSHELQLTEAESRLLEIEAQLAEVPLTITTRTTTLKNEDRERLRAQLKEAEAELEDLLQLYTERLPKVLRKQEEIARLKKELDETPEREVGEEVEILNPAYQELDLDRLRLKQQIRGHEAALIWARSQIAANEEEKRKVMEEGKYYYELLREKNEAEDSYERNRRALEAARTRLQAEMGDFGTEVTMSQRAIEPAIPYRKQRIQIALACLGAGVALGVAAMFALEFCDQSLRGVEDAAGFLEVPILGSVLTIITPEDRRRQWRRRMIVFSLVGAFLVASIVFWIVWNYVNPGMTLGQVLKSSLKNAMK